MTAPSRLSREDAIILAALKDGDGKIRVSPRDLHPDFVERGIEDLIQRSIIRRRFGGRYEVIRPRPGDSRRDAARSPIRYEVVPLPVAGGARREFDRYGDAQRYAREVLRTDRFDLAKIKARGTDGKWRELESWTLGESGLYRHHAARDASSRRARTTKKARRDPRGRDPQINEHRAHPTKYKVSVRIHGAERPLRTWGPFDSKAAALEYIEQKREEARRAGHGPYVFSLLNPTSGERDRDPARRVRVERGAASQVAWHGTSPNGTPVTLVWNGPGSRMYMLWHGQMIPIDHFTADANYRSFEDANRAARNFLTWRER